MGWTAETPQARELALRQALAVAPDDPDAVAGLLIHIYRRAIRAGERPAFAERWATDPAAAVIAGWRASGAGDWRTLRELEQRLTAIDVRHPLTAAARRLRVEWRAYIGNTNQAKEALRLLEPLLTPLPETRDLLLYARAGARADQPATAFSALGEALPRLQRGSPAARQATQILRSLPAGSSWRQELEQRLRRASGRPARATDSQQM